MKMLFFAAIICLVIGNYVNAWEQLPVYKGQEPYRNFTMFGTIQKNYGTYYWTACTHSMNFTCKDALIITPAHGDLEVGDVVVYATPQGWSPRFLFHRIVNITRDGYVMKGDNNPENDPFTLPESSIKWKIEGRWTR